MINHEPASFHHLPIPPSSNTQYKLFRRGNKTYHVPSDSLKAFKKRMEFYPYQFPELFMTEKHKVQQWVKQGMMLDIRCLFCFKKKVLFTAEDLPKKLDVSNRIKALHDCLSQLLGVDDSLFFKVIAEKAIAHETCEEMVIVDILPLKVVI